MFIGQRVVKVMAEPNGTRTSQGKPQYQFNGINSHNSSREVSPLPRVGYTPGSQLPPHMAPQLPPNRAAMPALTQKISGLDISEPSTPSISPSKFGKSTTNTGVPEKAAFSEHSSPVVPNCLENVPLNDIGTYPGGQYFDNLVQAPVSQYDAQNRAFPASSSVKQTSSTSNLFPQAQASQSAQFSTSIQATSAYTQPAGVSSASQSVFPPRPTAQPPSSQMRPNYAAPTGLRNLPQRYPTPLQPQSVNAAQRPQQQFNTGPQVPTQRFNPQINYNLPPAMGQNQPPPANATNSGSRYPIAVGPQQPRHVGFLNQPNHPAQGVVQSGFSRIWGGENYDLLQIPNILPPAQVHPPNINLGQEQLNQANCSNEIFRCTVTKIPDSASLLQKSRLPLGLLIHPFKDLNYLPVIQCNVIVRCRACRTYINPFVHFVDAKRWKCNLCFRVNELPEEFQFDPVSKTYGDPTRRPEVKSSTIEYIAPAEYMLRPPQPAVYLFLLDVSRLAIESGYLEVLCHTLLEELQNIPGDARAQIGFIAYDSNLHFFSMAEGLNQPHEMTILDIDDVFLPTPDNLLVNLRDRRELLEDLLKLLPKRFANTFDENSALGAALQIAHKLMGPTGGRVTAFQAALPNVGPGAVTSREDPNQRSTAETLLLNPVNDFYKRLALECSGQQIAVDLFVVNSQYVDLATISGISRFSGGSVHHFPLFKSNRPLVVDMFQRELRRYLTRKIGFEAVMRVRCTRGLAMHTFHGNLFVRSTDLLSLPNINPDAGFGMQVSIDESLTDYQSVCFQAALLYTTSKGERRIRVHTLCLPIANTLHDVIHSADQQCIIGLLGKMAVDRSTQASLSDAREAFINAVVDVLSAYKLSLNIGTAGSGLLAPECLKLLPLYIAAILKHPAFRIGISTRLDDRVKAMIDMKAKPLPFLIQQIYPDLYPVHNLELQEVVMNSEEESVPLPPRLQLSARCLENKGAFLMDCGDQMIILVGPNVSKDFLNQALGVPDYSSISETMVEIPVLDNVPNKRLLQFITYLNDAKPYAVTLQVLRENSPSRGVFLEKLIEDRLENSLSYHEFLQHLKTQVK
ncbi:hypothetical protein HUJ04_009713 [Dendroctonus ponderosae]|uniref:Protein transport protein Sec24A n=2 Tax=Dendroctonus ponderosae TaxID=77166 RepID=A0AAR5Q236_DENPD|nr:hypothetical protein HUJ04_009713 [Dendroctonus ponderosae]